MLIKKIKLRNIRSYVDGEIDFDTGSTLLAGDIGSGKSTILLAMEFALFGIKRTTLEGSYLLRHGTNEGSVELSFAIADKDILIKRNLKRTKDSVGQAAGYIIINMVKTDMTAVELKSKVLELLGYPKNLLSKSEDLIYRYTVYTPQEDMKAILFESRDSRLDTIRKVFGIDKYQRIKDNSSLFIRALKEKRKELAGKIYDLEDKRKLSEKNQRELIEASDKYDHVLPLFEEAKKKRLEKRSKVDEMEKKIKEIAELRKELSVCEANIANALRRKKILAEDIGISGKQIAQAEQELKDAVEENYSEQITIRERDVDAVEKELRNTMSKISEFNAAKRNSDEMKSRLIRINSCPTCYQDVSDEHKKGIAAREDEKISGMQKENEMLLEKEKDGRQKIEAFRKELIVLREKDKIAGMNRIKKRNLVERKERMQKSISELGLIDEDFAQMNVKKSGLHEKAQATSGFEAMYADAKEEHDALLNNERKLELQKLVHQKEAEALKRSLDALEKEISDKTKAKDDLVYLGELQTWMADYFSRLMDVMEKSVMAHLHRQFNELFQEWFKMMIEDDVTNVRLDDEFSPVIEQNGYETDVNNLSGGEKTSLSLAYRLSLNKVINDFVGEIRTKDLIILDEPTDGFSTEQLDKLRDVLDELKLRQVIIVSHEAKIESFVDRVVRVGKAEHVSRIIS